MFSFLSARVSLELSGDDIDIIGRFLDPILKSFDTQSWSHLSFIKFVMVIVVCNGGNSNAMSVSDKDETVQDRLIRLVTDN